MSKRALAQATGFDAEDADLQLAPLQSVIGGESRSGQLTGTKALMLAVLEDGIRSYLGGSSIVAQDAEYWIYSHRRLSPFSFIVVCEILGLDADAVRDTLKRMKDLNLSPRKAFPRTRNNVRIPGRVYPKRS
ncbi:MAG: hypothetical protein HY270_24715 [Deltaproteobacteria bacterium]|nr:hypothetical protein [Deltaproteobacteria bacterium]